MAVLTLRIEPDPILSIKTALVSSIDQETHQQLDDMFETMYATDGIGLAANQVGIDKRMFVMDVSNDPKIPQPLVLINPEILWLSDDQVTAEEGCLSIPGAYAAVTRAQHCGVKFLDIKGKEQTLEAEGLMAACIQHETDHLNGVLFIDHLTNLKRKMTVGKSRKYRKKNEKY